MSGQAFTCGDRKGRQGGRESSVGCTGGSWGGGALREEGPVTIIRRPRDRGHHPVLFRPILVDHPGEDDVGPDVGAGGCPAREGRAWRSIRGPILLGFAVVQNLLCLPGIAV